MSVDRSVRANSTRTSGVGGFGYAQPIVKEDEFDTQARARLNGEPTFDDSSPRFEDWSPAKQRAAYEGLGRADQKGTISRHSADEFLALHPEILDTNNNGDLINKMKTMFGDVPHTVPQFEAATQALLISDSLDIDKAGVAKQQQAAANAQRKAAIKNRTDAASRAFNQSVDYDNVSLEELRARANEELQQGGVQEGANGF